VRWTITLTPRLLAERDAGLPLLPANCGISRARSAGLEPATFSVRSHSPSQTGKDSGGQGATNQRFYRVLALLEGQGETPNCGQIAVKLGAKPST